MPMPAFAPVERPLEDASSVGSEAALLVVDEDELVELVVNNVVGGSLVKVVASSSGSLLDVSSLLESSVEIASVSSVCKLEVLVVVVVDSASGLPTSDTNALQLREPAF